MNLMTQAIENIYKSGNTTLHLDSRNCKVIFKIDFIRYRGWVKKERYLLIKKGALLLNETTKKFFN